MFTPANPPAFPRAGNVSDIRSDDFDNKPQEGMTLRDYFAAAALTGLLASEFGSNNAQWHGTQAYLHADAMLAAREEAK
jgi:hypothetical protein